METSKIDTTSKITPPKFLLPDSNEPNDILEKINKVASAGIVKNELFP